MPKNIPNSFYAGLVVLLISFFAARWYVGNAIEQSLKPSASRSTPRAPVAKQKRSPAPISKFGRVVRAAHQAEAGKPVAEVLASIESVDEALWKELRPPLRARAISQYDAVMEDGLPDDVGAALAVFRDQLEAWSAGLPSAPADEAYQPDQFFETEKVGPKGIDDDGSDDPERKPH